MNIQEAINTIKSGKFFSAEFIKKDGNLRKIHARSGVKKHMSGRGMAWKPEDKGYLIVWDAKKKEYRMLNTKTLLTVNKQEVK
jgi:hypothetical protein